MSRDQLMDRVWGYRDYAGGRVVDSHVARIRRKLQRGRQRATVHPHRSRRGVRLPGRVVSARPLEKLPTIRGKLGSTIVVAVGITIFISYALIGFALRNSPRDSEAIDALAMARKVAAGEVSDPPAGTMIVRRSATGSSRSRARTWACCRRSSRTACRTGAWWAGTSTPRCRWATARGSRCCALAHARIPGADLGHAGVPPELVVAVPAGRDASRR